MLNLIENYETIQDISKNEKIFSTTGEIKGRILLARFSGLKTISLDLSYKTRLKI